MVKKQSKQVHCDRAEALNLGLVETKTLSECLAVDQAILAQAVLHRIGLKQEADDLARVASGARALGISRQMAEIGAALSRLLDGNSRRAVLIDELSTHPSDTVRGWAAFMIGRSDEWSTIERRLTKMRPFAADHHFGVREWAWLAVRPAIAAELKAAIKCLTDWTTDTNPYVRRFAVESTRPRGVWCAHIEVLKERPELGALLLEPLRADKDKYVQDSVANWLNDASKSQPTWVKTTCARWTRSGDPNTLRIVKRALRTLQKKPENGGE
jgi:3-methyladenine DNA glycosylase AlkC